MNPDNWESFDSASTSSGVMVSNLPLLFANGNITSLQHMSLSELEVFLPFMVRCSVEEDLKVPWSQLPKPVWWPSRLPFRLPSAPTQASTKTLMVRLIERCYAFHGCQYLLQFCLSLRQIQPAIGYRFTDNRDGTTSMYHGTTGKLLVTFRNENKDYDKASPKTPVLLQKKLLAPPTSVTNNGVMVRPPISDVFLCDKCDDEFSTLREVQAHEKACKGALAQLLKMPSPEPESPEEDEEDSEHQVPFLSYLGLSPAPHTGLAPYRSPRKRPQGPVKRPLIQSYLRFDSIDVSSPLGKYILSTCKYGGKLQLPQQQVLRYEKYVFASPEQDQVSTREMRERSAHRWIVVWRPRRDEPPWAHLYTFTSEQKRERLVTIKTGLDKPSRNLLAKCRPCRVELKRLPKRTIDRATRLGGRSAPCIDLTGDHPTSVDTFGTAQVLWSDAHSVVTYPFGRSHEIANPKFLLERNSPVIEGFSNCSSYRNQGSFPCPKGQDSFGNRGMGNEAPPIENGTDHIPSHLVKTETNLKKLTSYGVEVSNLKPFRWCGRPLLSPLSEKVPVIQNNRVGNSGCYNLTNHHNSRRHRVFSPPILVKDPLEIDNPVLSADSSSQASYPTAPVDKIPSTKAIEVIDISSDEEPQHNGNHSSAVESSAYPSNGRDSTNRSHARPKNGYSHWSPEECSKCGRERSISATNGTTRCAPPQPSNGYHCCSLIPTHLNPSLTGQVFSSKSSFFMDSSPSCHGTNMSISPFDISEIPKGALYDSPVVALNQRAWWKAPLPIDEDITFNLPVKRLSDHKAKFDVFGFDFCVKIGMAEDLDPSHISANEKRVHSKVRSSRRRRAPSPSKTSREVDRLMKDECRELKRRGIDILDILEDGNKQQKVLTRCIAQKEITNFHSLVTRHNKFILFPTSRKSRTKRKRTISSQESDFKAIEPLPQQETERNPKINLKLQMNDFKVNQMPDQLLPYPLPPTNYQEFLVNGTLEKDSEWGESLDHNFNRKSPSPRTLDMNHAKRPKLTRELVNLSQDECKELRDLGFHPSDILGSYDPLVCNLDSNKEEKNDKQVVKTLQNAPHNSKRRMNLISFKGTPKNKPNHCHSKSSTRPLNCSQNLQELAGNNKRLSFELSKLMMDEWKELRACGSHPSQLSGLLSLGRHFRSDVSSKRDRNDPARIYLRGNRHLGRLSLNGRTSKPQEERFLANDIQVQNPRLLHREMIKTENALCVVNYALANAM